MITKTKTKNRSEKIVNIKSASKKHKNKKELWYFQSYKNSNEAIAITDINGIIIDVNNTFLRTYGYKKKEVIGKHTKILKSSHSSLSLYKSMWKDILDPKIGYWRGEITNWTKNKEEVPIILSITPIRENGNISGYMGMCIDISDRKRLERELESNNKNLEKKANARAKEIIMTQDIAILALAKLAEYRDPETGEHLERIRSYSKILAESLRNDDEFKERNKIDNDYIDIIFKSSPLHDIGKVGIPDAILLKPGKLTVKEFEIMKSHAVIGGDTLKAAENIIGSASFFSMGKDIAYYHHEKYDGTGYPSGLKEDKIPLSARIMALADVYDALTSKRVYKEAFTHHKSKKIILEGSGKHFDPYVVRAFLKEEKNFISIRKKYADSESKLFIMSKLIAKAG